MPEIPQEVIDQIDAALTRTVTVAITISPLIDNAYPDDPRWSPYTRWVKPCADRALAARAALRDAASRKGASDE